MKKERLIWRFLWIVLLLVIFSSIAIADENIEIGQSTAQALLRHFGTFSLIIIILLALATILWYKKVKPKTNWLWIWCGVLAAIGLAYSVLVFFAQGAEKGIVVCETPEQPEHCVISMHIHADVAVTVCGEEKSFGLEEGELAKTHTHKERNYIHFHERLPYDQTTETILDTTPLRVGNIFESIHVPFTSECLYDHCNGQTCSGKAESGRVKMWVNTVENTQFQDYVWKDGDQIRITFE